MLQRLANLDFNPSLPFVGAQHAVPLLNYVLPPIFEKR